MLPSEPGSAANSTDTDCPTQPSREDPAAISPSAFGVVVVYALTLVSFRLSHRLSHNRATLFTRVRGRVFLRVELPLCRVLRSSHHLPLRPSNRRNTPYGGCADRGEGAIVLPSRTAHHG